MKKLLISVLFCAIATPAFACDHFPRKRNTSTTVDFCLRGIDGFAKTDATFSAGDVKINIDEGGETNINTLPIDRGNCYSASFLNTELAGKRTYVTIINNAAYYPKCLVIETYGDSTALNNIPDVNLVQADGVATNAVAELSGVPGSTPTLLQMVQWVFELMKNKIEQTSTTSTVRKNDSSTELGHATTSDDTTTFTRGKYQ